MPPTLSNGKICYLEIPATDVAGAAAFYQAVFGWNSRQGGDGSVAFDDGVGEVSGTWVVGREPSRDPGLIVSIMVDDMGSTLELVTSNGGTIVRGVGHDAPEITGWFRDPTGNIFGLYQERA